MAEYVVYIDKVILGNTVMNYAILWSAARFGRIRAARWRLLAGAALGSLYSLVLFFPQLNSLLSITCKFIISVLMVLTAYSPLGLRSLFKALGYFYLSSFTLGGVVFGCLYFLRTDSSFAGSGLSELVRDYFWYGVVLALTVAWIVGKGVPLIRRKMLQDSYKVPLTVKFGGNLVEVEALLDTGNSLIEPLTHNPVIIVEYDALKTILPPLIQNLYEKDEVKDFNLIHTALSGQKWASRFLIIPFHSLGLSEGLLLGFRPDEIITGVTGKKKKVRQVVVGIYPGQLDPNTSYRALLHPEVIDECAA